MTPTRLPLARGLIAFGLAALTILSAVGSPPFDPGAPDIFLAAGNDEPVRRAPGSIRHRLVRVNQERLRAAVIGQKLIFNLFTNQRISVTVEHRIQYGPTRFTLSGTVEDGGPGAYFTMSVNGDAVSATISCSGMTFRVRANGPDAIHVIEQLDLDKDVPCASASDGGPVQGEPVGAVGQCDDGSVIDVLMLYTPAARTAAGGVDAIVAEIDTMIANANIALSNTQIDTGFNVVYISELDADEADLTLSRLTSRDDGWYDGVHALRDAYGADQVALIHSGGGGVANGLWDLEPESEASAFCLAGLQSAAGHVLAHEIGHNLGCCHAWGDGGGCPSGGGLLFPYSNGHRFTGISGQDWRTIQAYAPGDRILHWSHPDIMFDGAPTGVMIGKQFEAHNAQTIELSKLTVSNWRCNDGICEGLDLPSQSEDCNGNGVPDACDIALGNAADINGNGIPDECDCLPDVDGDGLVGVNDLVMLLANWGECSPGSCPSDIDGNGAVDSSDLLELLAAWGGCN